MKIFEMSNLRLLTNCLGIEVDEEASRATLKQEVWLKKARSFWDGLQFCTNNYETRLNSKEIKDLLLIQLITEASSEV